ncbi:MAG: phosphate acetyltransferase [Gemmatimonadales bacterium]|nr:MAG: phosphate acetyltransferase [Gemmatimonadales bacterium]
MDFIESIRHRARERPRRIVFPEGGDPRTLEAAAILQREALVDPVLLGDPRTIRAGLVKVDGDPDGLRILDPRSSEGTGDHVETLLELRRARGMDRAGAREAVRSPLIRGALMVRSGEVDGSLAGAVHPTGDVLRAAFWCVGPDDGIRTVSSSFYMVVKPFRSREPEILTFTDSAVVPDPTGPQLAQIAAAAARARRRIVGDSPTVAFLSYSTKGSGAGPSVDKVREALALFRDMEPGVPADGELQLDAALVESVARRKAPHSAVAGAANILVFPDLDAGNIGYKLVQRLAGAEAVGPIIQGLRRPCNDLSRGASVEDIVNVACITSLTAP